MHNILGHKTDHVIIKPDESVKQLLVLFNKATGEKIGWIFSKFQCKIDYKHFMPAVFQAKLITVQQELLLHCCYVLSGLSICNTLEHFNMMAKKCLSPWYKLSAPIQVMSKVLIDLVSYP